MFTKKIAPLYFLLLYSCASIVSPSGGPKDEKPPTVVKVVPAENTTNFKESGIDFYFDEYIVLNDINNQFLISPPMEKAPEIKVKGKHIEVLFKEPLKDNTTYTLNFGNGIADNNEANQLQGLSYTFSTGKYIDSLTLAGNVTDAFTLLPVQNVAVGLYELTEDSTVFKTKPSYMSRPDSSGNFNFKYLRPGKYDLVGFEDINRNLRIEQNERISFYYKEITLDYGIKDSAVYTLKLSPQPIKKISQIITAKEIAKGKYMLALSGTNCDIEILDQASAKKENFITIMFGSECDTLMLYTNNDCSGTQTYRLRINQAEDTAIINCKSNEYEKFTIVSKKNETNYDFSKPLPVVFSNPVHEIREQQIIIKEDSLEVKGFTLTKDSINPLTAYINYPWKEDKAYFISLPSGAFKDLYGQQNDSTGLTLKTGPASSFGSLEINVLNNDSATYIVLLMDNTNVVLQQNTITHTTTLTYKNLIPGHYFIKVIWDENRNEKWDGGDYFIRRQPEGVYITPKSTEVRANWELTAIVIDPRF